VTRVSIAAAQGPVFTAQRWSDIEQAITGQGEAAAARGAQLLLFPEYGGMVLTGLEDGAIRADLSQQIEALQRYRDDWLALHQRLARRLGVHVVAGSLPWKLAPGHFVNRAWICGPDGTSGFQDKSVMTRFEREEWTIRGGQALKVFDTGIGCLAISICYDIEFPMLARRQVEAGARVLLVPSCTDTRAGYWRVRVGAQARALENQCIAVQAPLVGCLDWSPAVDVNVGAAGIFAPPDRGFPDDGVLAIGVADDPGWVIAEVDLAVVDAVRDGGQVLNHRHWPEQFGVSGPEATVLRESL